jgi:hypothetical protein
MWHTVDPAWAGVALAFALAVPNGALSERTVEQFLLVPGIEVPTATHRRASENDG